MKITVIGDLHGRDKWKKIVHENMDSDKIIFLGDYVDIYENDFKNVKYKDAKLNAITNLIELIQIKNLYPDKIVLLLGNHDTHYIYDLEKSSRYDFDNQELIRTIFMKNRELFQYCYQINNHFFVHGGILQRWFNFWFDTLTERGLKENLSNLSDIINIWGVDNKTGTNAVNDIPRLRGGYSPFGGPTWADFDELISYKGCEGVNGLHQYVGHNKTKSILTSEKEFNSNTSITFCDVLHNDFVGDLNYLNLEI